MPGSWCPGCLATVTWAVTRAGKRMPLNPSPDPGGNQAAYRDGTGRWLTRQLRKDEEPLGYERRYMPHAATCTSAPRRVRTDPAVLPPNVIPFRRPSGNQPHRT